MADSHRIWVLLSEWTQHQCLLWTCPSLVKHHNASFDSNNLFMAHNACFALNPSESKTSTWTELHRLSCIKVTFYLHGQFCCIQFPWESSSGVPNISHFFAVVLWFRFRNLQDVALWVAGAWKHVRNYSHRIMGDEHFSHVRRLIATLCRIERLVVRDGEQIVLNGESLKKQKQITVESW